jgi:hypothetical protein
VQETLHPTIENPNETGLLEPHLTIIVKTRVRFPPPAPLLAAEHRANGSRKKWFTEKKRGNHPGREYDETNHHTQTVLNLNPVSK